MNKLPTAELERQALELQREVQRLRGLLEASNAARGGALRAQAEWEQLFSALPDFVAVIDCDYRIVHINRLMTERLNLSAQDAIGRPCYEVMHATGAPPAFCPHALAMDDGRRHAA